MEWISVKEKLPPPNQPVWIYWRDREVLIGMNTYNLTERENCDPSWGWYSFDDEKSKWTNWWMPIENNPEPPKD